MTLLVGICYLLGNIFCSAITGEVGVAVDVVGQYFHIMATNDFL